MLDWSVVNKLHFIDSFPTHQKTYLMLTELQFFGRMKEY